MKPMEFSGFNVVQHAMKRSLEKEEAIASSRALTLATRQPLNRMPRIKPFLRRREHWLAMKARKVAERANA